MKSNRHLVLTRCEERGNAGRVAYVIVNNPDERNALGRQGIAAVVEARKTDEPKRLMEAFVNRKKSGKK